VPKAGAAAVGAIEKAAAAGKITLEQAKQRFFTQAGISRFGGRTRGATR
jgi:hypothetical protein